MRSSMHYFIASALIVTTFYGCAAYEQPSDDDDDMLFADDDGSLSDDDEDVGAAEQASTLSRADRYNTITVSDGYWGTWQQTVYCNAGTYAVGYNIRAESSQGGGDDTGLNSVRLECVSKNGALSDHAESFNGLWGTWRTAAYCENADTANRTNFLKIARLNVESPQGGGDDTAANDVEFGCINGQIPKVTGAPLWGTWGNYAECPTGTAVCGLSIRFEGSQGGGDDTAMNGLRLECCNLTYGPVLCGNGSCEPGEDAQNCLNDCSPCGDNYCGKNESQATCIHDCDVCGNHYCGPKETVSSCAKDCDICGNGYCGAYEDTCSCPEDCGGNWMAQPICEM